MNKIENFSLYFEMKLVKEKKKLYSYLVAIKERKERKKAATGEKGASPHG